MASSTLIVKALKESVKDSKDIGSLSDSLVAYLDKNHLMHLMPNIIRKLELEKRREDKLKTIQISTSHEFDEKVIEKIKKYIEKEGDEKFETSVDSSLIGGFVIKGKNKIVDASLKRNLQFLRESLIK